MLQRNITHEKGVAVPVVPRPSVPRRQASGYTAPPSFGVISSDPFVSKHDTHFFNVFSMVIGLLVVVALALFALARTVAGGTQEQEIYAEPDYVRNVEQRLAPLSREAIAGKDNSALAIVETKAGGAAASALPVPKDGAEVFAQVCTACHCAGIAGAPKAGDAAAWGPRIAKGKDTLYQHALAGFQGQAGVMPAKGGRADLSDDLIKQGVDHMLGLLKK
jgi:cytochrome c5